MRNKELIPLPPDRERNIRILHVTKDCSLSELIEDIYNLKFRPGCAFFEFAHKREDISEGKEVILMSKVSYVILGVH